MIRSDQELGGLNVVFKKDFFPFFIVFGSTGSIILFHLKLWP